MEFATKEEVLDGNGSFQSTARADLNEPNEPSVASIQAERLDPLGPQTSFAALAAGRPLVGRVSARYLRDAGMYLYECASGDVHAAISSKEQLPLVDTVAWTLQRRVIPEFA